VIAVMRAIVAGGNRDRIVGPSTNFSRRALSTRYRRPVDAPLLDRDAELTALRSRLAAVRDGRGRLVAVCGPAGIGKSSVLAAAAASASADGMTVLHARAGPLEQDAAWGVVRQLFEPLRRALDLAEQLYVTQRTVETHLMHVFQKLGVAARAELPALVRERELVASPG
jgi:ATP/maltotriose-dependent transcriptional regulator MalT